MWICCVVVTGIGTSVSYHIAFAGSALNKRQRLSDSKDQNYVLLFRRIFRMTNIRKTEKKVDFARRELTG